MQSSQILEHDNMPFVSVAVYKKGVSNHCFNQINKLYPNSSIYIICPKYHINKFELLNLKNTLIIDEDDFIESINKEHVFKLMNFNYSKKSQGYNRRNWYWQQILKLCCCFNSIIPNKYIIIDSDFIMLSKIKFYDDNKVIFNKSLIGIEWDKFYIEKFVKHVVGIDTVKHGYISEYMLFEKKYVKEMLGVFGHEPSDIVHNLINTLSSNDEYDLIEYAWYANFMFKNYPDKVTTQTIYYYRLGHTYYGHRIKKYDLAIFKQIWKLDAVCIEPWKIYFFYFTPIYRFISYLRYKFNYYGRLPFSVIPKEDPAWVYNIENPLILKIYLKYSLIHKTYRRIRKSYHSIYKLACSK